MEAVMLHQQEMVATEKQLTSDSLVFLVSHSESKYPVTTMSHFIWEIAID
jgi:hypothetical protein